jgi:hypothetical protein
MQYYFYGGLSIRVCTIQRKILSLCIAESWNSRLLTAVKRIHAANQLQVSARIAALRSARSTQKNAAFATKLTAPLASAFTRKAHIAKGQHTLCFRNSQENDASVAHDSNKSRGQSHCSAPIAPPLAARLSILLCACERPRRARKCSGSSSPFFTHAAASPSVSPGSSL